MRGKRALQVTDGSGHDEGKVHSRELNNSVSLLSCLDGNYCDEH